MVLVNLQLRNDLFFLYQPKPSLPLLPPLKALVYKSSANDILRIILEGSISKWT
jgi:hypothetical protein